MNAPQKVVVAVSAKMDPTCLETLSRMDILQNSEFHFVHVVEESYNLEMECWREATPEEKEDLRQAVIEKLKKFAEQVLPISHPHKTFYQCLFSDDMVESLVTYVTAVDADFTIISHHLTAFPLGAGLAEKIRRSHAGNLLVVPEKTSLTRRSHQIAVAIGKGSEQKMVDSLLGLKNLKEADLQLIHFAETSQPKIFDTFITNPFSPEEAKLLIEHRGLAKLERIKALLYQRGFLGQIECHCQVTDHIKRDFSEYVNEGDFQLLVILEGEKRPFFWGFIKYQLTHAETPILILKSSVPSLAAVLSDHSSKKDPTNAPPNQS